MHVPLVVEQRRVPVWPLRQPVPVPSWHAPQLIVVQLTPLTLALHACISVVVDVSLHPPPALHVGVAQMRD